MSQYLALAALALTIPQSASAMPVDPIDVRETDAIECRLDVPSYMGFALALSGEEDIAGKRGWKKIASRNLFISEYELPTPIVVAGSYRTRRIAFTGSGILAILDLPDPAVLARAEGIENAMDAGAMADEIVKSGKATRSELDALMPFRKFLGERVVKEETEPARDRESYGSHTIVSRSVSNASTHPGKTFYGCSYKLEMLDSDGTPL